MSNNQLIAPSAFSSENGKAVCTTVNLFLLLWSPLYLTSDSQQTIPQHMILNNATPRKITQHDITTHLDINMLQHAMPCYELTLCTNSKCYTPIHQTLNGFTAPFDTNGVLFHIATRGGTLPYQNPHLSGAVSASMSSIYKVNDINFQNRIMKNT